MEAYEHNLPKDAPLRPLFLADKAAGAKPDWTFNMLLKHGVRSCLEYAKNFDLKRARSLSNPDLAPHLDFVDLGGHGYAKVRLSADAMRTEFVCILRPITRSEQPDGGSISIASRTTRSCGRKARSRFWFSASWKETLSCASRRPIETRAVELR